MTLEIFYLNGVRKWSTTYLPSSGEGCSPWIQPRYNEPQGGVFESTCDVVQLCEIIALVILS